MVNPTVPDPPKIDIAINNEWPGEKLPQGDPRWGQYTHSFRKEQHTLDSLITRVAVDGCSFCPVMRNSHRKIENFISAQHIGLDDDRGTQESSLEALADDPFIAAHAAFLYETPRSTPDGPKSRIVFILDQPFTDADEYRTAQEALWWKYGATDEHVKEPARFFYGRVNARHVSLNNVLYRDVLQEQVIEPYLRQHSLSSNGHRLAKQVGETIREHERNSTLASMAGTMRRRGFCQSAIHAALVIENQEKCVPPLPDDEVQAIACSVSQYPSGRLSNGPQRSLGRNSHKRVYIPPMVIGL